MLHDRAIHYWLANLDALLGEADACRALLAADELDRAARFHFELDSLRYVVCRGVLRRLIAAYGGMADPSRVAFIYGAHGKPALRRDVERGVCFNVAHSGGMALYAFTSFTEIGVDIERIHELTDLDALMRSCFAPGERAVIASLHTIDARHHAFFRCWTRKEAVLKALGWGLAKPLDSFEVRIAEDDPALISMAGETGAGALWRMQHLEPAPGFVGAAAWLGADLAPACFVYET